MGTRTSRDWRGIKHRLGQYSTEDLRVLLKNAELTQANIVSFAAQVATELGRRETSSPPAGFAGYSHRAIKR